MDMIVEVYIVVDFIKKRRKPLIKMKFWWLPKALLNIDKHLRR